MTSQTHNQPNDAPIYAPISFLKRIPLAISIFFSILTNGQFAARCAALSQPLAPVQAMPPTPTPVQTPPPPAPPPPQANPTASALQLLALFQRDARLIDFTQENLSAYSDADVGAAARVVHEGCLKVLKEHFTLNPIRTEAEGSRITLNAGFDAAAIRLTGNVVGSAPFSGSLSHAGWRASEVRLPKMALGHDNSVMAQAEVEL
jgi:hypothetical protein